MLSKQKEFYPQKKKVLENQAKCCTKENQTKTTTKKIMQLWSYPKHVWPAVQKILMPSLQIADACWSSNGKKPDARQQEW